VDGRLTVDEIQRTTSRPPSSEATVHRPPTLKNNRWP